MALSVKIVAPEEKARKTIWHTLMDFNATERARILHWIIEAERLETARERRGL